MPQTKRSKRAFIWVYEFLRYLTLLVATFLLGVAAVGRLPEMLPYGLALLGLYMIFSIWTNKKTRRS